MTERTVADAAPRNWVDRHAPALLRPYLRLARMDRPIGSWLLFWPCVWGVALAAGTLERTWPNPWHIALFFIGAVAMRGAGCTYNDIADRDIDARVARTANRPLPSGQVTLRGAVIFLTMQLLIGLAVLLQFNTFTILLCLASMLPVATYPFMKRITWWPQAMLGVCFAWGALAGWGAETANLAPAAIALYLGAVMWVIGYDTIYALQDIEDDEIVGVRSTARLFGERVRTGIAVFYALTLVLVAAGLWLAGTGIAAWLGLAVFAAHLVWQARTVRTGDGALALRLFRSNHGAGSLLAAGLVLDCIVKALT